MYGWYCSLTHFPSLELASFSVRKLGMKEKQPLVFGKDQGSWMLTLGARHFPKQLKPALRNDRSVGGHLPDTTSVKTGEQLEGSGPANDTSEMSWEDRLSTDPAVPSHTVRTALPWAPSRTRPGVHLPSEDIASAWDLQQTLGNSQVPGSRAVS